jgi:hypothetical protein
MTGRRHVMDSKGSSYEDCAQLLLGRIATLIKVPHEKDFGIDSFGQPRFAAGAYTETVADVFAIQVKGGEESLSYGGFNRNSEWKQYEIAWLKSLATPLYLVRVNAKLESVEVFSLWPLWWIFWTQPVEPFEIRFVLKPAGASSPDWQAPTGTPVVKGEGHGDGKQWTVDLGPPILRLTNEDLNNAEFRRQTNEVLRQWVAEDRMNLIRFQQFIPLLKSFFTWKTNSVQTAPIVIREAQFWASQPGINIRRLAETAEPILVGLGRHLSAQGDEAAEKLIPILSWLKEQKCLGKFGERLLDDLTPPK